MIMTSITDQIIRNIYSVMMMEYGPERKSEILDALSTEIGSSAYELVNPLKWVKDGIIRSKMRYNKSEAQALVARVVARHADIINLIKSSTHFEEGEIDLALEELSLLIHARMESCSVDELNQAATSIINLAVETGQGSDIENTIVCLLVFSDHAKRKSSGDLIRNL